jgi:hypothetical protein
MSFDRFWLLDQKNANINKNPPRITWEGRAYLPSKKCFLIMDNGSSITRLKCYV